ncbi:MAG TPA: hypothetical protein VF758_06125 [Candidatus Acidoferrum sp.]
MRRQSWKRVLSAVAALAGTHLLIGCGSSGNNAPKPVIQNINSSTTPTSPVGLPIEINGTGFQAAPGKVVFTQGSISATVVPSTGGWSDTGIVAVVPSGDGSSSFTLPGTVNVTVVTSGGTSNAVALNLIQTLSFSPSNMVWTTTLALPKPLTGLRAVAVPGATSTTAFAVVTGGFDGTANSNVSYSINLNADGTVGSTTNISWTTVPANSLPETRAFHAMAEADPTNSLVATTARYVYVIGGQKLSADAPGGTDTVFMASVDPTSGSVATWTGLTSTLPQQLVGVSAAVYNGYLYVAGGLTTGALPTTAVYSAQIHSDGTLGSWSTAANSLPTATSFGAMFAFGGKLYFITGDPNNSSNPNDQDLGTNNVYYASALRGTVGQWTLNSSLVTKTRNKAILLSAFGQVLLGEGIYSGSPGSSEFERSTVNVDGTLASWNGLTGVNVPSANVYNAAAFVSPLISPTQTPRFLFLGGQAFTATSGPGGALSNAVHVNSAP